jgi:hypothetical protein
MERKILHFSDKTGRVIVVYKLSSLEAKDPDQGVQLGSVTSKLKSTSRCCWSYCQVHSLPSTEFIIAANIAVAPHQEGWMRWNHLAGICN